MADKYYIPQPGELRKFTPLELLFYYLIHGVKNGNSNDVIEVEGRLDRAIVEKAIHLWLKRHPVLGSVVVRKSARRIYWMIPSGDPPPVDIRYHTVEIDDPVAINAHLRDNAWKINFDIGRERPIRFHLTETPSKTYLQIVTARLYNDGRTGSLIVRELAEVYNALSRGETWDSSPRDLEIRDNRLFLAHRPILERAKLFFAGLADMVGDIFAPGKPLVCKDVPRGPTHVERVELGADRLGRIKRFAKRRGITVHIALSVAFFKACADFNALNGKPTKKFQLMDLFSIRPFANVPMDEIFDTVVVPYNMKVDVDQSDDAMMKQIEARLNELKQGRILSMLHVYDIFLFLARFFPVRAAAKYLTRLEESNVMLSNPGLTGDGIESLGGARVTDVMSYSALFPPERFFVIMSTFRGALRATVLHDVHALPKGVGALISSFIGHLDRLAASDGVEKVSELCEPKNIQPPKNASSSSVEATAA